ncbi:hypothetical protein MUN77_05910 [Leucobacter allii]|uniref:hypothetical protein n=1 Tax=Leucobacter allii TaxID=2932247 RepID=UPI001FD53C57|nr:hypothetical protein [Leucobacter allii]UOR02844.1 hypothetical protein MUN77_05910 [Leucobacter allii]
MEGPTGARRARASARMGRGVRAARGASGALVATLLAAASHGLAGGAITWLAVAATALLALPLCTALAGRVGSLWRLVVGVGAAQFVYHWSFAGLGTGTAAGGAAEALPAHAAHLAALQRFTPAAVPADGAMWLGHALAAVLTVALLHRGEQAVLSLARLVLRALPRSFPRLAPRHSSAAAAVPPAPEHAELRERWLGVSLTHRGPPLPA